MELLFFFITQEFFQRASEGILFKFLKEFVGKSLLKICAVCVEISGEILSEVFKRISKEISKIFSYEFNEKVFGHISM